MNLIIDNEYEVCTETMDWFDIEEMFGETMISMQEAHNAPRASALGRQDR